MGPKKSSDITEQFANLSERLFQKLDIFEEKLTEFNETLLETKKLVSVTAETANKALELASSNKTDINKLEASNSQHEDTLLNLNKRINDLEMQLEDQTNRNMRSTLILKNVPGKETSWGDTSATVANLLHSFDKAESAATILDDWIERAHRIKPNPQHQNDPNPTKRDGPLNIAVRFSLWKYSEKAKQILIKRNNDPKFTNNIFVDQLQSKKLTTRTNKAKLHRKNLKTDHPDWKMFVAHPANLMCKKPGEERYKLLEEF